MVLFFLINALSSLFISKHWALSFSNALISVLPFYHFITGCQCNECLFLHINACPYIIVYLILKILEDLLALPSSNHSTSMYHLSMHYTFSLMLCSINASSLFIFNNG